MIRFPLKPRFTVSCTKVTAVSMYDLTHLQIIMLNTAGPNGYGMMQPTLESVQCRYICTNFRSYSYMPSHTKYVINRTYECFPSGGIRRSRIAVQPNMTYTALSPPYRVQCSLLHLFAGHQNHLSILDGILCGQRVVLCWHSEDRRTVQRHRTLWCIWR